jgi:hypothetical protein
MTRQPSNPKLCRIQGELNLSGLLLREKMRISGRAKGISKASLVRDIKILFARQRSADPRHPS